VNEVTSPTFAAPASPLQAGRDALARHAWPEAFESLAQADREGQLSGADLEHLAEAAFFAARADIELEIKERAFKAYVAEGDDIRAARARALLAGALRITDDEEDADLELRAAFDEFERLGARVDAASAERELRDAEDRRSGPVQTRKTFMFTDIVGSTILAEALGDQAWERLLRWHDDTLRGIVAGGGGEVVNSTGDGFFVAFDSPHRGIDCATAIQRALRDHRQATGFAISVRIGLHTSEANRRGADYSGMGVHVAARVAALAGGGEILATAETLADAGPVATTDARQVAVKGVSAPVDIASIAWS
jgi:class 3 adenylate cyclase